MIPILICAVIGFWFGSLDYDEPVFVGCLYSLVGAMTAALVSLLISSVFFTDIKDHTIQKPLATIQDSIQTEGEFFLGSGSIDGVPHYSWYEETDDDTYELRNVESDLAQIHLLPEDSNVQPYLERSVEKPINPGINLWTVRAGFENVPEYDFYVPRNSIQSNYTLDAK